MNEFIERWRFVRSETMEILLALNDKQLQFKPAGEKWQPMYHQFGCMARTQLVYADAAAHGRTNFALFRSNELPSSGAKQTKAELISFLDYSDTIWLKSLKPHSTVQGPDDLKPIELHIASLAEHERLHHGQLISYFTLAAIDLPNGFKANWAL